MTSTARRKSFLIRAQTVAERMSPRSRYIIALALAAASIPAAAALDGIGAPAVYAPALLVIALSVWLLGTGPALLVALTTAVATPFFVLAPRYSIAPSQGSDIIGWAAAMATAAAILGLGIGLHRLRRVAETALDRSERARARLGQLRALAAELGNAEATRDVCEIGGRWAARASRADRVWVAVSLSPRDDLASMFVEGYSGEVRERFDTLPREAAFPLVQAAIDGEAMFFDDEGTLLGRYPRFHEWHPHVGSAAFIPLGSSPSATIGAIGLCFDHASPLGDSARAQLMTMGQLVSEAYARAGRSERERDVSHVLQRSLLPSWLPAIEGLALAASYVPGVEGTEAGGDWYDAIELDDGRLGVSVGDVVGRGPEAAAVMGQLRSALKGYLLDGHSPGGALERLNRFARWVDGAQAATAVCLLIDAPSGMVVWASAGHPRPLLVDETCATYVAGDGGPLLGVVPEASYPDNDATITVGGSLLVFSDGIYERRNEHVDVSLLRLSQMATQAAGQPISDLTTSVVARMANTDHRTDDAVLLAVRRESSSASKAHESAPGGRQAVAV